MTNIYDLTLQELRELAGERGVPVYRANQIYRWLFQGATSFDAMTDLPKDLRAGWTDLTFDLPKVLRKQTSTDGTSKYLFGLMDGQAIETVFMTYNYGNTLCVSSQVGCRMGCTFCASTRKGLVRNLTAGEIIGQVIAAEQDQGQPVNHIVVMGIGEPFDNYEELSRFLTMIHEPKGKGLSLRNITVSTCGIIPMIRRFGDEWPQVNLAISLHAPNNDLRRKTMPVANRFALPDLMEACRDHAEKTGRRITYEYALIDGVNDTPEVIEELAQLLRGTLCHVNLIPLNEVEGTGYKGTARSKARDVASYLTDRGVPATVRRSLGRDIEAACGQLRLSENNGA